MIWKKYGVKPVLIRKKERILKQHPTEVRPFRAVEFTLLMVKETSYGGFSFAHRACLADFSGYRLEKSSSLSGLTIPASRALAGC
jgi:hypothetical protein